MEEPPLQVFHENSEGGVSYNNVLSITIGSVYILPQFKDMKKREMQEGVHCFQRLRK
jgi:hypothetical protein